MTKRAENLNMEAAKALKLYDSCWFGRKGPKRSGSRGFGPKLLQFYDRCRLFGHQFLDLIESLGSEPGPSQTAMLMASRTVESRTATDAKIRSGFDVGVTVCEKAAASISSEIGKLPEVRRRILYRKEVVVEVRVEKRCERREKGGNGCVDLGFIFSDESFFRESWSEQCSIQMDCRIPSLRNEIRVPDYLGVWARTVASSVR